MTSPSLSSRIDRRECMETRSLAERSRALTSWRATLERCKPGVPPAGTHRPSRFPLDSRGSWLIGGAEKLGGEGGCVRLAPGGRGKGDPRTGQGRGPRDRGGGRPARSLPRLSCTCPVRPSRGQRSRGPSPPHLAGGEVPGSCVRRARRPAQPPSCQTPHLGSRHSHAKGEGSRGRGS